jgi:hypothetical protein
MLGEFEWAKVRSIAATQQEFRDLLESCGSEQGDRIWSRH